jgi:hypothetical protein
MIPTLALERLMTRPDYGRIVEWLRATAPVHAVDQADAATAGALDTLTAVSALRGAQEMRGGSVGDVPGWLRLSLLDALAGFLTGRATTCRHSPDASHPQPIVAAAWKPGLITCRACAHLFALPPDADHTCDGCGCECAGVDHADPIYSSVVQLGPLLFQYGACSACNPTPPQPQQRAKPRGKCGGKRGRGR